MGISLPLLVHKYLKNETDIVAGFQWIDCKGFTPIEVIFEICPSENMMCYFP